MRVYIEYRGDSIEVPRGETLVGRDVGCALRFNDPAVSRRHLRLIRRADEAFVEDLQSSNGTLLNGRLVKTPVRLHDGDTISAGGRMLTVRVMTTDEVELPDTLLPENVGDDPSVGRARTTTMKSVMPLDERTPSAPTIPPFVANSRRHERAATELRVIYVSSELEVEALTRDLSHSGVFVHTQILEPIGTRCRLTFLVDGGPTLELSGIVRRVVDKVSDGVGLGIELVDVGDADRARIDALSAGIQAG